MYKPKLKYELRPELKKEVYLLFKTRMNNRQQAWEKVYEKTSMSRERWLKHMTEDEFFKYFIEK